MLSKTAVTYQIDDPDLAVDELFSLITSDFSFGRNSIGMLYCYSDMEMDELVMLAAKRFGFEIIGCTYIAGLSNSHGFHEMSVMLTVMTADDCSFSCGITSEELTADNLDWQVSELYSDTMSRMPSMPKLIYALPAFNLSVRMDDIIRILDGLSNNVPIIGGIPSYNENGDYNYVFYDGKAYPRRLALLIVSGNIRPLFSVRSLAGSSVERKRQVTHCEGNKLYTVGGQRFVDYMAELGVPIDKMTTGNTLLTFVSNPLLFENVVIENGEHYSFVRTLHKIDVEEGSGTSSYDIPKDATVSVISLNRENIESSAAACIEDMISQIQAANSDDYTYSTIIATSCIGRYLIMLPKSGAEAARLYSALPDGINLFGFYSYGEFCPFILRSGKYLNYPHDEALVLCAI